MKNMALVLVVVLMVAGCRGAPAPDTQATVDRAVQATLTARAPDSVPAPATAPAPTNTPAPSVEPTIAPTATEPPASLTDSSKEEALDTYKLLVAIQAEVNLLDETARRVASGELEGTDSFSSVMAVALIIQAVDEGIAEYAPPAIVKPSWEAAVSIHQTTRSLVTSWFNQEINADAVISEIASPLADIDAVLSDVDDLLETVYALDRAELDGLRDELVRGMRDILNTPTPPPDSASGPAEVTSDVSYTEGDYLYIIGEVENTSNTPMEYVKLVATLYDDKDSVVGTESTYTILDVIPPGGRSPFEMMTSDWDGMTRYKLQVQSSEGDLPETLVSVVSHRQRIDGDYYHIVGEVKNEGGAPVEYVKVIATLYDEADKVVGVTYSYAILDAVPAAGKSPFELTTDRWAGAVRYEIQAQASPGELGRQGISVKSHTSSSNGDYVSIVGEVQNSGDTDAEYVKVVVTFYDGAGAVAGVAYSYTALDTIPAGATSPFEVMTRQDSSFDHYEVQVQGQ